MPAPLPVQKIVFVGIKQAVKPMARRLVAVAGVTPGMRRYLLEPIGQWRHRLDCRGNFWMNNRAAPEFIAPLTEQAAVDRGAEIFLEFTIFGAFLTIVWYEYWYAASKTENDKNLKQNSRIYRLKTEVENFSKLVAERNIQIADLKKRVDQMENRVKLMEDL